MTPYSSENNMSVFYLALACLLYYLIASGAVSTNKPIEYIQDMQYVEVNENGQSIVYFMNTTYINNILDIYNIKIRNGDKITIGEGGDIETGRISGVKSISLGVPIGINSALAQDLTALPGIGAKTAVRIISYRENTGGFNNLNELDNVHGIGAKTMESLKGKISLD